MRKFWNDIWFKSIDARQFAALRIAFGCLSLVYLLQLLPYAEVQVSGEGWLGDKIQQIGELNGGSWSLFFFPHCNDAKFAYAVFTTGIIASFLLAIGWHSRLNAGIAWLIWVSLWNRNPLILDGDDALIKLMCFYLMLSPCGNSWSVDNYLKPLVKKVEIWPLRLIQFQISLIYFVSGWVKFYSQEWLDGTIIQYILIHPHYARWDGWTLIGNDSISRILDFLADLIRWWELLFPFLLINAWTRKICLYIGVLFHVGLLLTMNLRWFAVIMLALYPALLPNNSFIRLEARMLKFFTLPVKVRLGTHK